MTSNLVKPTFSIVLPTYNVQEHIERCIQSCINQTYKNIEIIFVDDCGNDNSIKIVKKWANFDKRIRIIHNHQNLGTFLARKQGVNSARGEYTIFLDPDDELLPDALEKIFSKLQNSPIDIVLFGIKVIKNSHISYKIPIINQKSNNAHNVLKTIFCDTKNIHYGTPGKMYLTSTLKTTYEKLSFIDERLTYAEDVLLLYAVAIESQNTFSINDALYVYHQNSSSISQQINYSSVVEKRKHLDKVIKYIKRIEEQTNSSTSSPTMMLTNQLRYNGEMMSRFAIDPETKKSLYFSSIKKAFALKPNYDVFLRLLVYVFSLTALKL